MVSSDSVLQQRSFKKHSREKNTMRHTLKTMAMVILAAFCAVTPALCQQNYQFATVDFPGFGNYNAPLGINNRGDIAGFFNDISGTIHGYIRIKGMFTQIDYPGSTQTYCGSVTEDGDLSGTF